MAGPLSHLRVLDLSRILAGPWAGQVFADLGAEVIKIERPGGGDDTRQWGPPWLRDADGRETGESAYFLGCNRGKRSVTVDITHPEGQALIRDLAAQSDILIENYKVGGLKKYGLDYDSLKVDCPRLIYCSITGFGQTGPYAHRAGYDLMIQGMGGLMSLTGSADGEPQKVGVAISDLMTGMYASTACLAALAHRERSGAGQYIDLALLDTQVAWLANQGQNYLTTGEAPRRFGNGHPNIVPYQVFAVADGHVNLAVGNDAQFARFCELAGHPEWAADERFASNAGRVAQRAVLVPQIADAMAARPRDFWLEGCAARGIPCGPINDLAEVFADPQVQARGLRIEQEHPAAGSMAGIANPIRYSQTPLAYENPPPLLGEHSDVVLEELLGLDAQARATLRERGVI